MKYILIYECLQLNKDISYDYYNSMKKIYILRLIVFTFILLLLPHAYKSHAVDNPTVSISPSSPLLPNQAFTVNVANCSAGDRVWIGIYDSKESGAFTSKWVDRNAGGTASAGFGGLRDAQKYFIKIECNGVNPPFYENILEVALPAGQQPTINISPATTLFPKQDFIVNVLSCSVGESVWVGIFEDGANTSVTSKDVARGHDGSVSADFTTGSKINQSYTVRVNCGGLDTNFPGAFKVEQYSGTITLRHEQTQPNSARVIAEFCPPKSEAHFEYWINGAVLSQSFLDTSDSSGMADFRLNIPGNFLVKVHCGGKTSDEYTFIITEDGSQGAAFPTLPPPPEPPCGDLVNGKCLNIDTPIGNISTDGIGIIYNLFTIILSLSGGILVLIIMYAGYLLMMSRGNPEQIQKAREILIAAIVGFLFIIFSYVIFGTLTDDILNLPGFLR